MGRGSGKKRKAHYHPHLQQLNAERSEEKKQRLLRESLICKEDFNDANIKEKPSLENINISPSTESDVQKIISDYEIKRQHLITFANQLITAHDQLQKEARELEKKMQQLQKQEKESNKQLLHTRLQKQVAEKAKTTILHTTSIDFIVVEQAQLDTLFGSIRCSNCLNKVK